jgi:glycosyltransferase involved in cell wall biosynthesis
MRILALGPFPPQRGGGHISRARIFSGLARRGHRISVIAPITYNALKKGDWFAAQNPELNIIRYRLHRFEYMTAKLPTAEFIQSERKEIEALFPGAVRDLRPDLVIIGREDFCRYVTILAKQNGLPCVLLARGNPTYYILSGIFPREETRFFLNEFGKVDRILTVADYMTRGLQALGISHVETIPNVIDVVAFSPKQSSRAWRKELVLGDSEQLVLVPGVLSSRKRPFDVLEAASLVLRRKPSVHFLLAGEGPMRVSIEKSIAHKALQDRVHLLGWVDYEWMPDLYNTADIVVVASEAEGMSRAYLEAMACGRTLLASDIAPACDLVEHGINGLLYPLGDTHALANAISDALSRPDIRESIGAAARSCVENCSEEAAFNNYEKVFRRVVKEFRRPRKTTF